MDELLDEICNSSVAVTYRELLALRRIGVMGTFSPPTERELEDMRVLRELTEKVEVLPAEKPKKGQP